jgi:hypothetical protein
MSSYTGASSGNQANGVISKMGVDDDGDKQSGCCGCVVM